MIYFTSPTGKIYAYEDGYKDVPVGFTPIAESEVKRRTTYVPTANDNIKLQIYTLESSITPRRLREAVLGTDNGWLADIESQIAVLRSSLST